ncbi:hypothetical protein M436DRAFT_34467, partial [Aureobasidium namibiae CBS 147.97]
DLQDLINHVALPPQLPQSEEPDPSRINGNLMKLLQDVAETFDLRTCAAWASVSKMLSALDKTEQAKALNDVSLRADLKALKSGDCFALHLPLHNSALLFLRKDIQTIVVEAFELSASNEKVMSTQGRLTRDFPGRAVTCSSDKFFDTYLQIELHTALDRLRLEGPPKSYQPRTVRSGHAVHETRDTMLPGFVNDYLMTILSVVGKNHASVTSRKNTRDDVLWNDTKLCWRRQPFWLLCKVAVLRTLSLMLPPEEAQEQYKLFMLDVVARLLKLYCQMSADPHMLSVVHAKLARRALKFEQKYGRPPSAHILAISSNARTTLEKIWSQHTGKIDTGKIGSIEKVAVRTWTDATLLALPRVREQLTRVLSPPDCVRTTRKFTPDSQPRCSQDPSVLPSLMPSSDKFSLTELVDVETWVEHNLASWTKFALSKEIDAPCDKLERLIRTYWLRASIRYKGIPTALSYALLVILELWVALDKICILQIPLMAEYSPTLSATVVQCLLLSKSHQMQRLYAVESYIKARQSQAALSQPSVFAEPTQDSLCVRYYDSSPPLQNLRAKIDKHDEEEKAKKALELATAMDCYNKLMADAKALECSHYNDRRGARHHSPGCVKCQKESQAAAKRIKYVEKSLPEDIVQLKAAIFEIQVPVEFAAWRDATWFILNDVGQRKASTGVPAHVTVLSYAQLKPYAIRKTMRVTLGSYTKPTASIAHYEYKALPTSMRELCVPNNLKYKVRDTSATRWVEWSGAALNFRPYCTLSLPPGAYSSLDWAMRTSEHSTNEVLSRQNECDVRLEKNEYLAFGNLRAGERIQWINILRELGCTNLDFTHPAVATLVLQAVWEAGTPSNNVLRNAHAEFANPTFCARLLSLLRSKLVSVENNWDRQYSMMVVIQLTLRLLSLASDSETESGCLQLLHKARSITLDWCHQIELHIHQASGEKQIQNEGVQRVLLAALLCYSTFDVEDQHIRQLLDSDEDLAIVVEAQSIVCDNTPGNIVSLALLVQQSLIHHLKIAHKLEPHIRVILQRHGTGLTSAVRKVWNGACLGSTWTISSNSSWVWNNTVPGNSGRSQQVHYNLLRGNLLVDGKSIGKVPDSIKNNNLFSQLFGGSVLRIFASDIPGMDCRISQHIEGNEVHLGMRDGKLIVKARLNGQMFVAIPQKTFNEALPIHFVEYFHHWMNESTGEIEFRPLDQPWHTDEANWKMHFSSIDFGTAQATLQQGSKCLIDVHNTVGRTVTAVFRALDTPTHCHITFNKLEQSQLEVDLSRYNLHFTVSNKGQTKSLEFNALVDADQEINTLIGLQNKLVLRSDAPSGCPQERQIIIPLGPVKFQKTNNHVIVTIGDCTETKRRHFVYRLNRHLRKLQGAQDLLGHLYLAYLHAVTSFCLPDPFTRVSGTEEALTILSSASIFTSSALQPNEVALLEKISALTPKREFYPPHLRVMQNVSWDPNLPALAQHDDFSLAVQSIVDHHAKFELACGLQNTSLEGVDRGDPHLLERARKRNSVVVRAGIVTPVILSGGDDLSYGGRDKFNKNPQALRVHDIAALVKEWPSKTPVHTDLEAVLKKWGKVSGYHTPFDHGRFSMHDLTTLNLSNHWGSLYEMCQKAIKSSMTYPLMFTFSALIFGKEPSNDLRGDLCDLYTLLAFAMSPTFNCEDPPLHHCSYDLSIGSSADFNSISKIVGAHVSQPNIGFFAFEQRKTWNAKRDAQIERVTEFVLQQWPSESITPPPGNYPDIQMAQSIAACQARFLEWHKNRHFLNHIASVNKKLRPLNRSRAPYAWLGDDIVVQPLAVNSGSSSLSWSNDFVAKERKNLATLDKLVTIMSSMDGETRERYASILRSSTAVFRQLKHVPGYQRPPFSVKAFRDHRLELARLVDVQFQDIRQKLGPSSSAEVMLDDADLWPRTSESAVLCNLTNAGATKLAAPWKTILLAFAERLASLQRAERMLKSAKLADYRNLCRELETPGREGWSPHEQPSWLLLEIENNITIRPLQAKVAKEMMCPTSGVNSVMQLNMGEGKSSVIVPMLATALADGDHLVRIVVLKSLLRQTEQVLMQRLGGLLGHRICHVPFSRKTTINNSTIRGVSEIADGCRTHRGIMIVLPEEILSMKLMSREKIVSESVLASSILDLQHFLKTHCRDVIDESDEILGIRSQLIYPVGSQHMLDGKSDRWIIAQGVLRQVKQHVITLAERFPSQLNAHMGSKSFPDIKFLDPGVFEKLPDLLIDDAIEGRIASVSLHYLSVESKVAIRNFIKIRKVSKQDLATLSRSCMEASHWKIVLLLRGYFARDILSFVLQRKRWLVEYGLDSTRCLMAVPYRAKGVPTQNSEFGHPDVGVLLTCLSYYYTGLSMTQVEDCFKILLKNPDAQDVYTGWALASGLPADLSSLDSINLDDRILCNNSLFPRMQYNLECIDFFLNQVVFPKEGKEFAKRLSASGWDIPSISKSQNLLTTGFSGTNDSRIILPHSIEQQDLDELQHTNAMMLDLLLRPENQEYIHGGGAMGKNLSVTELLSLLSKQIPALNVLIDVGAQVLEATNHQFARQWLQCRGDAKAAIYFDDQDEPMALDRSNIVTPLRISPLFGKLEGCLVYMDEVHTRGIDLAIPVGARAAVTLGPRLVKDRLTQACMRLRQLGKGHSLCFIAPTEVHRSICGMRNCADDAVLTSFDVLAWSMEQTCQALEIAKPLRAMHGLEYLRQQRTIAQHLPPDLPSNRLTRNKAKVKRFWKDIQEDESRSLELLYGVQDESIGMLQRLLCRGSDDPMMQHLVAEYDSMNTAVIEDCNVDNEQERELAHEVERQTHVERPGPAAPLQHIIDEAMRQYIKSGTRSDLHRCLLKHAFRIFEETSVAQTMKQQDIDPRAFGLYASKDFCLTVHLTQSSSRDQYLRPVNWVLRSTQHNDLLVVSPFEVNELLPQIKQSEAIRLHTFAPRVNKAMVSFNDLQFYTLNAKSRDANAASLGPLNLFAGSLYLDSEAEYEALRGNLGVKSRHRHAENIPVQSDGFVEPEIREKIGWPRFCAFTKSPIPFLKEVIALRRNGQGFGHTHMGHLLSGKELRADAF